MKKHHALLYADVPLGFCPGCSHRQVTEGLAEAMERTGASPTDLALVTDIGCVGLIDKHFAVNTFHGLHGRSVTYGTGLKLARPELSVLVAIGDGGFGIGASHLIHAARRDLDLTVVVFNNFNYGMTGGEHSPTTPVGGLTSSTPGGSAEVPLDLCAVVEAAGATFVARSSAFHGDLGELIARAMAHPGFALIDAWELCTAYFGPRNAYKKKDLLAYAEAAGLRFGVLREAPRAPADAPLLPAPAPVDLTPAFPSQLDHRVGLVLAGSAGQKVKSAVTLLGRAAARSHAHVTQKDDYPITVKTGHSVAELALSPEPVHHTGIASPDILIALTDHGVRRVRAALAHLPATARVYADARLELPDTAAQVHRLDLTPVAREVGREYVALWALAHVAGREGLITAVALEDTAQHTTPSLFRDDTLRTLRAAAVSST